MTVPSFAAANSTYNRMHASAIDKCELCASFFFSAIMALANELIHFSSALTPLLHSCVCVYFLCVLYVLYDRIRIIYIFVVCVRIKSGSSACVWTGGKRKRKRKFIQLHFLLSTALLLNVCEMTMQIEGRRITHYTRITCKE